MLKKLNGAFVIYRDYYLFEHCITTEVYDTNLTYAVKLPNKHEVKCQFLKRVHPTFEVDGIQVIMLSYFNNKRIRGISWQ